MEGKNQQSNGMNDAIYKDQLVTLRIVTNERDTYVCKGHVHLRQTWVNEKTRLQINSIFIHTPNKILLLFLKYFASLLKLLAALRSPLEVAPGLDPSMLSSLL